MCDASWASAALLASAALSALGSLAGLGGLARLGGPPGDRHNAARVFVSLHVLLLLLILLIHDVLGFSSSPPLGVEAAPLGLHEPDPERLALHLRAGGLISLCSSRVHIGYDCLGRM